MRRLALYDAAALVINDALQISIADTAKVNRAAEVIYGVQEFKNSL